VTFTKVYLFLVNILSNEQNPINILFVVYTTNAVEVC